MSQPPSSPTDNADKLLDSDPSLESRVDSLSPITDQDHRPSRTKRNKHKQTQMGGLGQHGQQSLNHLLNFSLPPRQTHVPQALPRRSRKTSSAYSVWNKEKFVNAQYRFVMNPNGDYTVHFADPDIFFQWQDILQVIIPRNSALAVAAGHQSDNVDGTGEGQTTCPICLSPPAAPRMTKCGHIFCFSCLLHYLHTSDHGKWARCPICFDSITESQLKSVKWFEDGLDRDNSSEAVAVAPDLQTQEASSSSSQIDNDESPKAGSILRMRLIVRPQITTLALPRSATWPSDALPPHAAPFHFMPDIYRFARFMLATPDYLLSDLSRDLDALSAERKLLDGMKDELGVMFIDRAVEKVRRQMERAAELETELLRAKIAKSEDDKKETLRKVRNKDWSTRNRGKDLTTPVDLGEIPVEFLTSQSQGSTNPSNVESQSPTTPKQRPHSQQRPRRNVNPPPPSSSTYYFYQAANGSHIFLHPLDIRILLSHFGSYSAFPELISIRVEASEEGSIDDDLRKRCKYLAHLPESANVVFVEADLLGVVGEEGLRSFEQALKLRRSKRKEKEKKEERARVRAEEKERERLANQQDNGLHIRSLQRDEILSPSSNYIDVNAEMLVTPPDSANALSRSSDVATTVGAWGNRSFATAAQSRGTRGIERSSANLDEDHGDDWDVDAAWHELESRASDRLGGGRRRPSGAGATANTGDSGVDGGRRRRNNRGNRNTLVLLGGQGGRRR